MLSRSKVRGNAAAMQPPRLEIFGRVAIGHKGYKKRGYTVFREVRALAIVLSTVAKKTFTHYTFCLFSSLYRDLSNIPGI